MPQASLPQQLPVGQSWILNGLCVLKPLSVLLEDLRVLLEWVYEDGGSRRKNGRVDCLGIVGSFDHPGCLTRKIDSKGEFPNLY